MYSLILLLAFGVVPIAAPYTGPHAAPYVVPYAAPIALPYVAQATTKQEDMQLVVFSADWCGPCREMEPIVAEMQARDYPVRIVNVAEQVHGATLRKYKINELPAYVMYYKGKSIEWSSGLHSRKWLVDWFSRIAAARATRGPLTDPLNAEVFREKHWVLSPSTCWMMNCPIHRQWVLE